MTKQLFESGVVYPSDSYGGRYVELVGKVTQVHPNTHDGDDVRVTVNVPEFGEFDGWAWRRSVPNTGYEATIRVYDIGGGWYRDHRIVGWGRA